MSPSTKSSGKRRLVVALLALVMSSSVLTLGPASAAEAGAAGQNPVNCANPQWRGHRDFNVNGWVFRQELRYSSACGRVGWARLTRIGGSGGATAVVQSAWNPGRPSQGNAPGGNWTYTVDASPGREVCGGFHGYRVDSQGVRHHVGWFFTGCYRA